VRSGAHPINGSDIGVEVVSLLEQITRAMNADSRVASEA
jgi:hypothetical protein